MVSDHPVGWIRIRGYGLNHHLALHPRMTIRLIRGYPRMIERKLPMSCTVGQTKIEWFLGLLYFFHPLANPPHYA